MLWSKRHTYSSNITKEKSRQWSPLRRFVFSTKISAGKTETARIRQNQLRYSSSTHVYIHVEKRKHKIRHVLDSGRHGRRHAATGNANQRRRRSSSSSNDIPYATTTGLSTRLSAAITDLVVGQLQLLRQKRHRPVPISRENQSRVESSRVEARGGHTGGNTGRGGGERQQQR